MPYCPQCGTQVSTTDQFCAKCGGRQPAAAGVGAGAGPGGATASADFMPGLSSRHAALICYIPWVGWLGAIIVLASERFRHDMRVRFHAFQGLYLFVAWLIVEWVISPTRYMFDDTHLGRLITGGMQMLILIAWIFMMVKVTQDHSDTGMFKLPIVGDLAERSACEQRT